MNKNRKTKPLSNHERKIITQDSNHKIFISATISLVFFFGVLVFSISNNDFGGLFIVLSLLAVVCGIVCFRIITRNHRSDLLEGIAVMEDITIEDKIHKIDYEAGSATVPTGILSFLFFKKIATAEMKKLDIYYVIVRGEKVFLQKDDFDKVETGKTGYLIKSPKSNLFLGIG